MRLTPNAVCQQDETIVTLIGTDASGEYKTKTFTVLVNDSTSGSCTEPDVGVIKINDDPVHNYVGAFPIETASIPLYLNNSSIESIEGIDVTIEFDGHLIEPVDVSLVGGILEN